MSDCICHCVIIWNVSVVITPSISGVRNESAHTCDWWLPISDLQSPDTALITPVPELTSPRNGEMKRNSRLPGPGLRDLTVYGGQKRLCGGAFPSLTLYFAFLQLAINGPGPGDNDVISIPWQMTARVLIRDKNCHEALTLQRRDQRRGLCCHVSECELCLNRK